MPIWNPVAFIGEYILGSSAGIPLVADSNGQLAQGLSVIQLSSTTNATTTSGTMALLTTMSVTAAAGTYLYWFSSSVNSNDAGATITMAAYNNGTQLPESVRTASQFDGGALSATSATGGIAMNGIVTVTSGTFAIQWSTSGGTATCGPRILNMLRTS